MLSPTHYHYRVNTYWPPPATAATTGCWYQSRPLEPWFAAAAAAKGGSPLSCTCFCWPPSLLVVNQPYITHHSGRPPARVHARVQYNERCSEEQTIIRRRCSCVCVCVCPRWVLFAFSFSSLKAACFFAINREQPATVAATTTTAANFSLLFYFSLEFGVGLRLLK